MMNDILDGRSVHSDMMNNDICQPIIEPADCREVFCSGASPLGEAAFIAVDLTALSRSI